MQSNFLNFSVSDKIFSIKSLADSSILEWALSIVPCISKLVLLLKIILELSNIKIKLSLIFPDKRI